MSTALEATDAMIQAVMTARSMVQKTKPKQVRAADPLATLQSTAHSWFNTQRPLVASTVQASDLAPVDLLFRTILDATVRHSARQTYLDKLKEAKSELIELRALVLQRPTDTAPATDDLAPDFSPLAGNQEMRDILTRRWHECCKCVGAEAHLAAVVMMGGLLEALFVARANKMRDKSELVGAASAPRSKGKVLNYQQWTLDAYIRVGAELGWITISARDVADVLKEYRNYVHPEKERRHGVVLSLNDSSMFWQVTKALVRQLLLSAVQN